MLRQLGVPLGAVVLQVVEQALALGNHLEKSSARAVVLEVFLEMLGEPLDFLRKKPDLNLRRTGVLVVDRRGSDHLCFL